MLSALAMSAPTQAQTQAPSCNPIDLGILKMMDVILTGGVECDDQNTRSAFVEVALKSSPDVKVRLTQQNSSSDAVAYNADPTNVYRNRSITPDKLSACIADMVNRGLNENQIKAALNAASGANSSSPRLQAQAKDEFINGCF